MALVETYKLRWNSHDEKGSIEVRLKATPGPIEIKVRSAAEFMAVAHMLTKADIEYDPRTGVLDCHPRNAGT
jgi:hypothetical protein